MGGFKVPKLCQGDKVRAHLDMDRGELRFSLCKADEGWKEIPHVITGIQCPVVAACCIQVPPLSPVPRPAPPRPAPRAAAPAQLTPRGARWRAGPRGLGLALGGREELRAAQGGSGGAPSPPPPPRTKRTRRVPHPVLVGHAAPLTLHPECPGVRGQGRGRLSGGERLRGQCCCQQRECTVGTRVGATAGRGGGGGGGGG